MALKSNQSQLLESVQAYFNSPRYREQSDHSYDVDSGHGRIEERRCWVNQDIEWLKKEYDWSGLHSIVCLETNRTYHGKTQQETRYYLSSLSSSAAHHLHVIRSHWAIENSLHWVLYVTFSEDHCRIRSKNAPENIGIMRRICLNLLRQIKTPHDTIESLRMKVCLNTYFLEKIIQSF